ncbi:FAD:protein FMN transferase [Formosa sediminum]|uniref:FAD:protein FMN transferase n=1 Tax=Formosa sediminum TaxID=2594004 RepID=A0A516GQF0_9FLAO|nr:FAD:protein FMN transferase [Formosa sediminum]QDO93736.1 FAD:protein FMN transferase [Formosa sediminum]
MKHFLITTLVLTLFFSCKESSEHIKLSGSVFGTTYGIQYFSEKSVNYQSQLDSLFEIVNQSMSTYIPDSNISLLNDNKTDSVDKHFAYVFNASKAIYKHTNGAFDPTIGVLVNAWSFGPEKRIYGLDSLKIDSLMQSVGLDKIRLEGSKIIKDTPNIYIDFNAIAKGYSVDVVGRFLESKHIDNYLVEIGGEIRTKGINIEKNKPWKVGVEMPHFDGTQSLLRAIELKDMSMATSGTYRKFKVDLEGNRFSHIIDPHTGYPSKTNLLSISVLTDDCMIADAYATAFKAMGIDGIKSFIENRPELKVFLIYENEKKELATMSLNGFPE